MSAVMMIKKCEKCKKTYTYNPSVGKLGNVCPHCGALQKINDSKSDEKKGK